MFKGIVGMLKPLAGHIERGACAAGYRLPAAGSRDRPLPIALYDMVAMGLWHAAGLFGGIGGKGRCHRAGDRGRRAHRFEDRPSPRCSGGQTQRMLFARLLLQDARVIVLDEPFSAVDAKTSVDLFDLVRRWHQEQRTVLTAMHDMDFVRSNFPETLLLARAGRLGPHLDGADAGEPSDRAPHVRGIRPSRGGVRG